MSSLQADIVARLVADYGFRAKGPRLVGGRCPACAQPEAYTPPDNPRVILCPRKNHCGEKTLTRNLYPDLYQRIAQYHPPTQADPNATARAALAERGFSSELVARWEAQGWWRQGRCKVAQDSGETQHYHSIRFDLAHTRISNHRLIDYPGSDKTRTYGSYRGQVWAAPGQTLVGDVWVCEAVLDALSLITNGLGAVSTLAAGHVPEAWLDGLAGKGAERGVRLIIAYDNDKAGLAGALKLADACAARQLPHALALPPQGRDWNDLQALGLLPRALGRTLEQARVRGDRALQAHHLSRQLAAIEQAGEGAAAYYKALCESNGRTAPRLLAYRGSYYVGQVKDGGDEGVAVHQISDYILEPLYQILRREPWQRADEGALSWVARLYNHRRKRRLLLDADTLANTGRRRALLG